MKYSPYLLWLGVCLALAEATPLCTAQVSGPIAVPGRVEAEDYDASGPGKAFHDTTPGNSGAVYRTDDVDIEPTTDAGGGYNVGWIASGEWLNYTVNVLTAAVYQLEFRVASPSATGNIQVALDNLPLCSVTTLPTGGWQSWQTVTVSNLALPAGQHVVRLEFRGGGQNFNYVQFVKQGPLTGFLRASGKQIVDGQGRNVILRGIGTGNWMLQEPYMMDASGIVDNQQQLKAKIAELVGPANRDVFYASWLTNYMREADVIAIAQAGFNSIRLPMHYNVFTLPIEQEPVSGQNTWLPQGFKLVDDLLGWCEANRIYLILDMHGCPGGQGKDKPIADYDPSKPSLWEEPANRAKLVALWRELAVRYADRQWIGGYDLINEPNWTFENRSNLNGCEDTANTPLRQLQMDITAAIRQVDTNHIIFIEGNCWGGNYGGILPPWDPNLVISFHKYWDQPTAASFQGRVDQRDQWNMPIWLGESGENSNEWFRQTVLNAEALNIGWAWWPWKKIGTITGPVMVRKPAGYQGILDYWRNDRPRPGTNEAMQALLALAGASRFENCTVRADVLDALLRNGGAQTLPFKTHAIPGLIFAADYDLGAAGAAYNDQTLSNPHNSGNHYRNDAVDIEPCTDVAPTIGYNVGWLDAGDWMKYSVPVPAGPFSVAARVAADSPDGRFSVRIAGQNVTGPISVPSTGGWQNWITLTSAVFTNPAPAGAFNLEVEGSGFNLSWVKFTSMLLPQPASLKATATSAGVELSWPAVPGAMSYSVLRSSAATSGFQTLAQGVTSTNYTDLAVTNGVTFRYVVTAVNSYGEGPVSPEALVEVPFPPLSAARHAASILLSWPNPASNLTLTSTTSLAPPVVWVPITNAPLLETGVWKMVCAPVDSVRFFQLSPE